MPQDPGTRAQIEAFVKAIDKSMVLNIGLLVIECLLKPKDQQRDDFKQKKRQEVAEAMKELDQRLEGKEYLFGDYSLADVAITPHVAALPILGSGIPASLKNMNEWFDRIRKRPSFEKSQG